MVIGLDSAPLFLLEPWIKAGELPNLGKIISQSAYGILNSTIPPLSPSAWSSFATGMNPGKHGVFDHGFRQNGTYKIVPTNARIRGGKTLWQLINESNGRSGVINVPETFPPEKINGFMISGMSTPSDEADWCAPETIKGELLEAIGGYKVYGQR
jgi:predicted AlkP superfamily phosphohydrolase/phosphomutase